MRLRVTLALALTAAPVASMRLSADWKATDGFRDASFCSFDPARYQGMINDDARTSAFAEAIHRAIRGREGELVVLDIGTGPAALLALIAARAGARRVYAVEVQSEVAALAREAVAQAVVEGDVEDGVVQVFEGFSTALECASNPLIHP